MSSDDSISTLLKAEALSRSGRGFFFKVGLFSRWLDKLNLSLAEFQKNASLAGLQPEALKPQTEQGPLIGERHENHEKESLNAGPSKETGPHQETPSEGKTDPVKRPSLGSIKNWRAGMSVSKKMARVILTMMNHYDDEFQVLLSLNKRRSSADFQQVDIEDLVGFWEEVHFTSKAKNPAITKALVCIRSLDECFYTVYAPKMRRNEPLTYKGSIELESGCIVFRVETSIPGLKEKLALRYPHTRSAGVGEQMRGLVSGINFDRIPMAATSVMQRKAGLTKHSLRNYAPKKFQPMSDGAAIRLIRNSREFFEFGPRPVLMHNRWKHDMVRAAIRQVPEGETIDIMTSYMPIFAGFYDMIEDFAEDDAKLRKFRCLFLDPEGDLFRSRFGKQMANHRDAATFDDHQKRAREQVDALRKFSERGGEKCGVHFEILHADQWISCMGLQVGKRVLFYGNLHATASALDGPMLEVRNFDVPAAKLFRQDLANLLSVAKPAVGQEEWNIQQAGLERRD